MMKLYDESIRDFYTLLSNGGKTANVPVRELDVQTAQAIWSDVGKQNMILRDEMAYELGGGNLEALSSLSITCAEELVSGDEVCLLGPDIPQIAEDISYARLTIIRVKEDSIGEGNELYNAIRQMEYVRYHLNPKGYMMRISASNEREPVRVASQAIKDGLDFSKVGKLFLDAYHRNPKIEAVKLIFITQSDFPYKELKGKIRHNEQVTKAIDHILKNVTMDCNICSLKEICDEVEGMKELHFGTSRQQQSDK